MVCCVGVHGARAMPMEPAGQPHTSVPESGAAAEDAKDAWQRSLPQGLRLPPLGPATALAAEGAHPYWAQVQLPQLSWVCHYSRRCLGPGMDWSGETNYKDYQDQPLPGEI